MEAEYRAAGPAGAIADDITARLQAKGCRVDYFTIRPRVSELKASKTIRPTGERRLNTRGNTCSVAVDDIRRTEYLAAWTINYYIDNQCKAMVCEVPSGGAQSAISQKQMALATAMIATVRTALQCPAIWVTPNESRGAAGWDKNAHPLPEGLSAAEHTRALGERKKALKRFVMDAMATKYPAIADLDDSDKEHIADALATFEAVKGERLVKLLEGI